MSILLQTSLGALAVSFLYFLVVFSAPQAAQTESDEDHPQIALLIRFPLPGSTAGGNNTVSDFLCLYCSCASMCPLFHLSTVVWHPHLKMQFASRGRNTLSAYLDSYLFVLFFSLPFPFPLSLSLFFSSFLCPLPLLCLSLSAAHGVLLDRVC